MKIPLLINMHGNTHFGNKFRIWAKSFFEACSHCITYLFLYSVLNVVQRKNSYIFIINDISCMYMYGKNIYIEQSLAFALQHIHVIYRADVY